MFDERRVTDYIKNNLKDHAITIYSIKDDDNCNKIEKAKSILKDGLNIDGNSDLKQILSPKGLVNNIKSLPEIIKNKTFYHDRDICNIIISTPQTIQTSNDEYYIGYPKNNVSGYTTASHQTNYDCFLTDYLENIKCIFNNMVLGYYYEDSNKDSCFVFNENHYSLMDNKDKDLFFTELLEKIDNKISSNTNKKEILNYMKDTITNNKCDFNSKYLTALEYLEYKDCKFSNKSYTKDRFINLLKTNYQDYSLYIHGVDQENPKTSKSVCTHILNSVLHIDWEYGLSGTCEPKGPIDENDSLYEDLDYHYGDNKKESYNIILLIPKILEDLEYNSYFMGYSRKNTTGTFPKSMKDFDCLVTDIINDFGYVPQEFIFAYQVYGSDVEEEYFINTNHLSFISDDLQRVFTTKFLNTKNNKIKENINTFSLNNINEEELYFYANPLVQTSKMSSLQNTSLEYFDYKNNSEYIKRYIKKAL